MPKPGCRRNGECRRSNDERNPNAEIQMTPRSLWTLTHLGFVIPSSFGFCPSSFKSPIPPFDVHSQRRNTAPAAHAAVLVLLAAAAGARIVAADAFAPVAD